MQAQPFQVPLAELSNGISALTGRLLQLPPINDIYGNAALSKGIITILQGENRVKHYHFYCKKVHWKKKKKPNEKPTPFLARHH